MASIQKRPDGKWRARFTGPDGRERAKHFDRKVDAQAWINEQTAAVVTGQFVRPSAGKVTFRECGEEWRQGQVHRPSTQAHTERMLRRYAYPAFGDRPIDSILPSHIQTWVRKISGELAPSTVAVAHGIVSAVFKAAMEDQRLHRNPCKSTRLPKVSPKRIEPLPTEAVLRLQECAPPRWRACIMLAAGTGLRNGEVLGLTVDRVDFLRRQITVDRQLVQVPGRPPFLADPKTPASVRTVPLPAVVVEALAAHLQVWPAGPEGWLFPNDQGGPMGRTRFSRDVWVPTRTSVGLPAAVTFHDLRHYYASLLIRHGESVKTVQARLGHASAAETLDTYSHLWPDSDDRTREAVDAVFGKIPDSTRTRIGGGA